MADADHDNADGVLPGGLRIRSERDGGAHVVAVSGELDIGSADELEAELQRVEGHDAQSIVLDLSAVEFVDSSGLRVILAAADREKAGAKRLRILRGRGPVRRLFALTGTEDLFSFVD